MVEGCGQSDWGDLGLTTTWGDGFRRQFDERATQRGVSSAAPFFDTLVRCKALKPEPHVAFTTKGVVARPASAGFILKTPQRAYFLWWEVVGCMLTFSEQEVYAPIPRLCTLSAVSLARSQARTSRSNLVVGEYCLRGTDQTANRVLSAHRSTRATRSPTGRTSSWLLM